MNTHTANIQIVDDSPENLDILASMLMRQGYEVRTAMTGTLALNAVCKHPPDLILLDIKMPGMDGYEICKRLKADDRTSDIPVIFISALGEVVDKAKAFSLGGVDYITKPFQEEEVLARVATHLSLRKSQQGLQETNERLRREIDERKRTEEALRESEETIRALVESSRDWIWAIDVQGFHTYSNPAIEKILGYHVDEVVGKQSLALMHEDDRRMIEGLLSDWIAAKSGWNNLLIRWRHKDGSYRYLESNAVPILTVQGELRGFRGVDRDITERKLAEEKLKKKNEDLETFNRLAVARELKMVELKKEINQLLQEAGKEPRYKIADERLEHE